MTKTNQLDLFDQFTSHLRDLTQSKGSDYAGAEDVLSNFKIAGDLMGTSPSQQCLSMICTKVARLTALLRDGQPPKNESIQDSCLDAANYFFLLAMLEFEKQVHYPIEGTIYPGQGVYTGIISVCTDSQSSEVPSTEQYHDIQVIADSGKGFTVRVSIGDIERCATSVNAKFYRGSLDDFSWNSERSLDFTVPFGHPALHDIVDAGCVVLDGWPFHTVHDHGNVVFYWNGDIPTEVPDEKEI